MIPHQKIVSSFSRLDRFINWFMLRLQQFKIIKDFHVNCEPIDSFELLEIALTSNFSHAQQMKLARSMSLTASIDNLFNSSGKLKYSDKIRDNNFKRKRLRRCLSKKRFSSTKLIENYACHGHREVFLRRKTIA